MHFFVLLLFIFSSNSFAHEIQSTTQFVNLRRQKESGWYQAFRGKMDISSDVQIGAEASYLERFDLYDKQVGGLVNYRPGDRWTLEAKYLQGKGNEILPEKQTHLTAYYALGSGLSPFIIYRDSRYSLTTVHSVNLGMEIEKIPHIIFIPMIMSGKATFKSPGETEDINSYGLRVTYYTENRYSFSVFGFRGKEASQGIIGRSTEVVDTLSGGFAGTWFFNDAFKSELVFDHTDFDQLKTEFHTLTLNLTWMF